MKLLEKPGSRFVVQWLVIATFKKWLGQSPLEIKSSNARFFLVLDQYWRLDLRVRFLEHFPHKRLGAITSLWQPLHLAYLAVGNGMTAIS